MKSSNMTVERLHELLIDRAGGEDLGQAQLRELDRLRARYPEIEPESFEQAAAALHVALVMPRLNPLPPRLRARLLRDAQATLPAPSVRRGSGPLAGPWPGWLVAAAAIVLWMLDVGNTSGARSPEEVRRAPDVVQVPWTATDDPGARGASGEVYWSDELQSGYMVFRGLAPNDPGEGQYQLWIFDAERPAEYPVDGGVFDATGLEVTVPINAKLAVAQPTLFAITYERPGGVVVSARERLLLTGKN